MENTKLDRFVIWAGYNGQLKAKVTLKSECGDREWECTMSVPSSVADAVMMDITPTLMESAMQVHSDIAQKATEALKKHAAEARGRLAATRHAAASRKIITQE